MFHLRQFIVWRSVVIPGKTKPQKIPYNPQSGKYVSAQDRNEWMGYDQAQSLVTLYAVDGGVAFVLSADDPYTCIDLDGIAQPDGTWSPFAQAILARFPGAYVELSASGSGLHLWFQGSLPDGHRTRSSAVPGLEVYTTKRFIALGSSAIGNPETDHTAALMSLMAEYLPGEAVKPSDWRVGPVDEWAGPEDDDELIRRMVSASGGLALMQGRAAFIDLWECNTDVLAATYGTETPGEPWDRSGADAALCAHLAWWTGKDCPRIARLFERSALMRDKWADREAYQMMTITRACATVQGAYNVPGPDVSEVAPGNSHTGVLRKGVQLLDPRQQIEYFKGCVYVRDDHKVMVPDGMMLDQGRFNAAYGGYDFLMDFMSAKNAKGAWECFTESRAVRFPKVTATCFRPNLEPGLIITEEGWTRVNTYQILDIPCEEGDVSPFLDLVGKLFPDVNDRAIILAYIAACVQHQGVKFQWTPLIQGAEGNGKTFLATCVSHAVGKRYSHTPNARDIGNKFTGWIKGRLFACVEEVYTRDRFDCTEALKPLITNEVIEIQSKGADQCPGDNKVNFYLTTNHRDAIIKTRNDRRYAVFFTPQQEYQDIVRGGMGGAYFPNLYKWFRASGSAHITHYLKHYQIPEQLNPATLCTRAPVTTSTDAAIYESMGMIEQEITEAIHGRAPGFRGDFISSVALIDLISSTRVKMSPRKRNAALKGIGYIPHPALPGGRTTRAMGLGDAGRRITIYVKETSQAVFIRDPEVVMQQYQAAQESPVSAAVIPIDRQAGVR